MKPLRPVQVRVARTQKLCGSDGAVDTCCHVVCERAIRAVMGGTPDGAYAGTVDRTYMRTYLCCAADYFRSMEVCFLRIFFRKGINQST